MPSKQQLCALPKHELELKFRQAVRGVTRDSIGGCVTGILAFSLPWMLIPGVYSTWSLCNNVLLLRRLKKVMRDLGIRIKKRLIMKGLLEGLATKTTALFLTFGHDEFITMTSNVSKWLQKAGSFIAERLSMCDVSGINLGMQRIQAWDSDDSMRHGISGETQRYAAFPVDHAQKLTGTGTVAQKQLGWHESGSDVAKQVVIVGGAALVTEKLIDTIFDRAYDYPKDLSRRHRIKNRIKSWFR